MFTSINKGGITMVIDNNTRELIENFIQFLINDECILNYTSKYHLNIEDYIDRYENLEE